MQVLVTLNEPDSGCISIANGCLTGKYTIKGMDKVVYFPHASFQSKSLLGINSSDKYLSTHPFYFVCFGC